MAQLPAALQVGSITRVIRHGGFGTVFIGTHTPKKTAAEGLHEMTILQQLGPHANIVGYVGHHIEGPSAFLVTEAAHHEWFDDLANGPPPLAQTQAKFAQALAGLALLHARLQHRPPGSQAREHHGTPQWLARPHRLRPCANAAGQWTPTGARHLQGHPKILRTPGVWLGTYDGVKSDVWSLGVCLFTACAGFHPFDHADSTNSRPAYPIDWRFQRAQQAQAKKPPGSTVEALFASYDRPCPFPQPLTDLLDGLLRNDEQTSLTVAQAIASPWVQALYAPGVMPVPLPVAPPPPQPPQVPLPVAAPPPQQVVALADIHDQAMVIHDQAMVSAAANTMAATAGGFDTGSEPCEMSVTDAGSSEQMGAAENTDLSAEPTSPTSPPPKQVPLPRPW